ncbi:MAG: TrpR, YerC/YecD [Candidatus Moraniibacteriota bacterium]|nr:MAG: TrpR, YerC/YecD [Candidatus Moranbacteria bacterium]
MKWDNKKTEELINVILLLENKKEAKTFLRDLLTASEIAELSNRWRAAQMLSQKIPYTKVEKETGLSSTTVARVSRWLQKGKGGYKAMITKVNALHHSSSSFEKGLD